MQVRCRRQAEACRLGKKGFFLTLISFTAILSLLLGLVNARIKPVVETVGTARAKAVANASIMRAVEEELKEHAEEYRDLTMLRMGQNGEISAVQSNIVKINQLKTRISERVAEEGTLFLTRLELAALVEQTLKEETGVGFRVVSVGLSGSRDNVTVSELCFSCLNDRTPDEIADILRRRLGLNSAVQEVREP